MRLFHDGRKGWWLDTPDGVWCILNYDGKPVFQRLYGVSLDAAHSRTYKGSMVNLGKLLKEVNESRNN